MSHNRLAATVSLAAAGSLLLLMTLQYPLSVTFPAGGDAPTYIITAKEILKLPQDPYQTLQTIRSAWYPLTHMIFTTSALVPMSWPQRFIWWMVLGHIVCGVALARMLHQIAGWQAAASGFAIWALVPIVIDDHFESATMAQLWSLALLLLFFERLLANALWGATFALIAALLAHPITGAVLIITLTTALPAVFAIRKAMSQQQRTTASILVLVVLATSLLLVVRLIIRSGVFSDVKATPEHTPIMEYFTSSITPYVIVAPYGLLMLVKKLRQRLLPLLVLLAFMFVSLLLAFNNTLGIGAWTHRLQTYLILATVLAASVAWPPLVKFALRKPALQVLWHMTFFATMAAATWQHSAEIYSRYESPSRYARLHSGELTAIEWMRSHLPEESRILTTTVNRHSEWIPALTDFVWFGVQENDRMFTLRSQELYAYAVDHPATHMTFFLRREKVPQNIETKPALFHVVYKTKDAVIIELPTIPLKQ